MRVEGGVIDADYRGEVKVLLFNAGDEGFKVEPSANIAQFLLLPGGYGPVQIQGARHDQNAEKRRWVWFDRSHQPSTATTFGRGKSVIPSW